MKWYKNFLGKKVKGLSLMGVVLAVMLYLPTLAFAAYDYRSDDYNFKITAPEKPPVISINYKEDSVMLDFANSESEYPYWVINYVPPENEDDHFLDPTTLSSSELDEYLTGLQNTDYDGAKFQKAEVVKIGKYNATLVVTKDEAEICATIMVKTEKRDYAIALFSAEENFAQNYQIFKKALDSFAEI